MSDTEKVSFNISVVDLGKIDLLAEQGFYSSRTDFIRTAIRNLMATHSEVVQESVTRRLMVVGVVVYGRNGLERTQAEGKQLEINVVGLVALGKDVSPELARATIRSIQVFGVLRASDEVKEALADRIK